MSDKIKQNQKGGQNSTNIQGESININHGISYADAKEIALDVFKSNFLELSKQASETAAQRAEELVDDFIQKLGKRKPESIYAVNTPGLQYALYNAQKEYARTGDKELSDVLVDVLVDRANQNNRNLMQIVLDESINAIPKLTIPQMDVLTLVFLLKYSINYSVNNDNGLRKYLETFILPFTNNLSKNLSLYQHLEYSGCASISLGEKKFCDIFNTKYRGLFFKGFTNDQVDEVIRKPSHLFINCINDNNKLQLNAINEDILLETLEKNGITEKHKLDKFKSLFSKHIMSNEEIKNKFIKIKPEIIDLIDIWDDSTMKNLTLTSVGIAIAHANLRRKTGITIDLNIWIK